MNDEKKKLQEYEIGCFRTLVEITREVKQKIIG